MPYSTLPAWHKPNTAVVQPGHHRVRLSGTTSRATTGATKSLTANSGFTTPPRILLKHYLKDIFR